MLLYLLLPFFYSPLTTFRTSIFPSHVTPCFLFLSLFPLFRGSHRVVDKNHNFTCYGISTSEQLSACRRTVVPTSSGSISPRRVDLKILKIESTHSSETPVITCLSSRTTCILLALVFLPPFLLPLAFALYLLLTITCLPFVYRQKAPRHPDPSITPRRRKVCCLFCCLPHLVGPSGQRSSFSWDGVS